MAVIFTPATAGHLFEQQAQAPLGCRLTSLDVRSARRGLAWDLVGQSTDDMVIARALLLPDGGIPVQRDIATWRQSGTDTPDAYFTDVFILAQLESIVGAVIDHTMLQGSYTAGATGQLVARTPRGSDIVQLRVDACSVATVADLGHRDNWILLRPFVGLVIDSITAQITIKGNGTLERSIAGHLDYTGIYECAVIIDATGEALPLGYEMPGKIHLELAGALLVNLKETASR